MFHAWQFDLRGNCVYVAREKEGYQDRFSKNDAGLRRLRCVVNFGGFVWVNMNDQPIAMLEEWAGEPMSLITPELNSTPLEVVHYHKEFENHGYKACALGRLEQESIENNVTLVEYGHAVIGQKEAATATDALVSKFPATSAALNKSVYLFPGYVFSLEGPVLNVTTVTPVDVDRTMIEYRGLVPKGENPADRKARSKFYNLKHGPFRLLDDGKKYKESSSANQNQPSTKHYNDEWLKWMDRHPSGEGRITEVQASQKEERQDDGFELAGPHVAIIGASHAGISCADRLRKNGFVGKISIFDRQVGGPMERPPLSKGFLLGGGETVESKSLLRQRKWYKSNKIKLKTQSSVDKIDAKNKTITVKNGGEIKYDKLVIASGAVPKELPTSKGIGNAFTLRQPSDANSIRQASNNSDSVVIIGGGYIGLEVAASLKQKGMDITVLEGADRILARVASKPLADHLLKLHNNHGVKIITGAGVEKINQEDGIFDGVTLSDGQVIKGDMLITGIGVFPDSMLALDAGIETQFDNGGAILVDEMMCTSDPDVYAIGDVAIRRSQKLAVESVNNAQESASVAAAAIVGNETPAIQTPWFWSDQYDAKLQSVGIVPVLDAEVYQVERPGKREGGVSFWTYKGDNLLAVEVVNDPATYMEARQCLDTRQFPDPKQIAKPTYSPVDSGGARS
jgi:NADPH-dependent 2,4-dienoyl-CoA reductase/sulfur reductase-like enzyme